MDKQELMFLQFCLNGQQPKQFANIDKLPEEEFIKRVEREIGYNIIEVALPNPYDPPIPTPRYFKLGKPLYPLTALGIIQDDL